MPGYSQEGGIPMDGLHHGLCHLDSAERCEYGEDGSGVRGGELLVLMKALIAAEPQRRKSHRPTTGVRLPR